MHLSVKIQLASDLHLEFLAKRFPGQHLVTPHPEADVLVLAGDICTGTKAIDYFGEWPVPVIYVRGNHESYGGDIDRVEKRLRAQSAGTAVHFLERDRVDLAGVRFLGCTLWTDYELPIAQNLTRPLAMNTAACDLYDHKMIKRGGRRFMPLQALNEHQLAHRWLTQQLAVPWSGPTVVVTHHGVHPRSVHPRFAGNALNAAFVSDLGGVLERADLWMHGHVHDGFDYRVGRARVVANPRGYPLNNLAAKRIEHVVFETLRSTRCV